MKEKLQQHQSRPFHITVAAAGKDGIDNDLRMLRSALVYGDQVKLCSHTTTGVLFLFSVWSNPLSDFVAWGEENIVGIVPDPQQREKLLRGIESYRAIAKKKHPSRDDLVSKMRIQRDLERTKQEMKQQYPALTKESDIKGIQTAIKTNLLDLYTFKSLDSKGLGRNILLDRTAVIQQMLSMNLSI